MKKLILILLAITFVSCSKEQSKDPHSDHNHSEMNNEGHQHEDDILEIDKKVFESMNIEFDSLTKRNLSEAVYATGHLRLPPNNEATVTAMVGANIKDIKVIEGDKVAKGQTLVVMHHPNLVELQTNFIELASELKYLEQEYARQEKLYDLDANSGKSFQKVKSEYMSKKARYNGERKKLEMLKINADRVLEGEIAESISISSPIAGYVTNVAVRKGQYINPNDEIISLVNNDHLHADLMIFEKDAMKVKKGQKVRFSTEFIPNKELNAKIYSVGKVFEENPKAVHIHAEITDNKEGLIPGLYIKGTILIDSAKVNALPETAIVRDGKDFYAFLYEGKDDSHVKLRRVKVITGLIKDGWVEVKSLLSNEKTIKIAQTQAYFLQAEMDKGSVGHSH
ncbi:MAG: efflux RND transporter periplasmic adaptor subunit [Candidatus Kapaibacterium sp.]|nr:efflux RND transporter periplasmic adaptor subunit [Ignavibacteriota bacterium]MCB9221421.1 efflux RND transporter periplasmic adaptor subunit [Ignavibacteria bacterium]